MAAYLMSYLLEHFIENSFRINLGASALNVFGSALEPVVLGGLTLGIYWLILFWMFRNKVFVRI